MGFAVQPPGWMHPWQLPRPPLLPKIWGFFFFFFEHLNFLALAGTQLLSRTRKPHHLLHDPAQQEGEVSPPWCRSGTETRVPSVGQPGAGCTLPARALPNGRFSLCSTGVFFQEEAGPSFGFHCLRRGNGHRTSGEMSSGFLQSSSAFWDRGVLNLTYLLAGYGGF